MRREGQARFAWLCSTEGAFKLPRTPEGQQESKAEERVGHKDPERCDEH